MLVNGRYQNLLPVADRAVQYGDGAFETILVQDHKPIFWQAHLERLTAACRQLQIPADLTPLRAEVEALIASHGPHGVLKIIVSRGEGGRGYSAPIEPSPTRIVQISPFPLDYPKHARQGISVYKCRHPLSSNVALAGLKHLNRLDQVLASLELPSDMHEGLMCNESGDLIEGIKSNVFVVIDGVLLTPELHQSGVAGIMRSMILKYSERSIVVRKLSLEDLRNASECLVCNSVMGIWPVTKVQWDNEVLTYEIGSMTRALQAHFVQDLAQ